MSHKDLDLNELDRYLAGESAPDLAKQVEGSPSLQQEINGLRASARPGAGASWDTEAAIARLTRAMKDVPVAHGSVKDIVGTPGARASGQGVHGGISRQWYIGVPMAIAAALLVGVFGIKYVPNIIHTTQPTPTTKTYATQPGQRAKITLASGAQVTLAPATTLRVTGSEATLDGQAVFTVLHRTDAPFTVRTGNTITRVLGTTFSVRNYDNDSTVSVIVAEGKVAFQNKVLSIGDMGVARAGSQSASVLHDVPITAALAWTSGRLVFNRAPLSEIIPDLERWYNVEIVLKDPQLASRTVTTSIDVESRAEAAQLIAELVEAVVSVEGRRVILSPRVQRYNP